MLSPLYFTVLGLGSDVLKRCVSLTKMNLWFLLFTFVTSSAVDHPEAQKQM